MKNVLQGSPGSKPYRLGFIVKSFAEIIYGNNFSLELGFSPFKRKWFPVCNKLVCNASTDIFPEYHGQNIVQFFCYRPKLHFGKRLGE